LHDLFDGRGEYDSSHHCECVFDCVHYVLITLYNQPFIKETTVKIMERESTLHR
jgi:hypothetical protein